MSAKNNIAHISEYFIRLVLSAILITVIFLILNIFIVFSDFVDFGLDFSVSGIVTNLNDNIFDKTALLLRHLVKPTAPENVATVQMSFDSQNVIDKANVCLDNDVAFSKQDTDNFEFNDCLIVDNNRKITSYPMIVKICHNRQIGLENLDTDMMGDKVYAILPQINCKQSTNFWFITESVVEIFPLKNDKFDGKLTINDIDTITSNLNLQMDYLDIEINRLKSKTLGNHEQIINEIQDYLKKTYLPDAYKTEIEEVFGDKSNQENLDEYLSEVIANFKRLTADNIIYKKDLDFFEQLYEKCYQIDSQKVEIARQSVCLYDMIYKNKRPYFDTLNLTNIRYVPSHILNKMLQDKNLSVSDIKVEYGNKLTVGSQVYPINKTSAVKLNKFLVGELSTSTPDLSSKIYNCINSDKYVRAVNKIFFCILIGLYIFSFVVAMLQISRLPKYITLCGLLLLTAIINGVCVLLCRELNVVSVIILLTICLFMSFIDDLLLNSDNATQKTK